MRYALKIYAHALAEAAVSAKGRDATDAVTRNFLGLLDRTGDRAALRTIVPIAERLLLERTNGTKVVIESARPIGERSRRKLDEALPKTAATEERIVPDLLAGVRITVNDERQLDGSLAHALNKLFSN